MQTYANANRVCKNGDTFFCEHFALKQITRAGFLKRLKFNDPWWFFSSVASFITFLSIESQVRTNERQRKHTLWCWVVCDDSALKVLNKGLEGFFLFQFHVFG